MFIRHFSVRINQNGLFRIRETFAAKPLDVWGFRNAIGSIRGNQTYILSETKHLGPGSECPPRRPGILRLYSMKMCPFAQRTRLVLSAKNITHEVVNVNLKNKPGWYLALYAPGQVPALERDGLFVPESLVTSELLEELYPDPALLPSDPWQRAADRCLVTAFAPVIATLYQMYFHSDDPAKIDELYEKFDNNIQPLVSELARRGTAFLSGGRPGMTDLMVWPWIERLPAFAEVCGAPRPLLQNHPLLADWTGRMLADGHVIRCVTPLEDHVTYLVTHKPGIVATQRRNALKSAVQTDRD